MNNGIGRFTAPVARPPETGSGEPAPVQISDQPQHVGQPNIKYGAQSRGRYVRDKANEWRISRGSNASGQTPAGSKPGPAGTGPRGPAPVQDSGPPQHTGQPTLEREAQNRGRHLWDKANEWRISKNPNASGRTPEESRPLLQRPYRAIKLQSYADYGTQQTAAVLCTDYARQAAESLIDHKGELDPSHIPRMLDDLDNDKDLPLHHRKHLKRILTQLQANHAFAAIINNTVSAQKPLRGPAADLVRATLNLPPEHPEPGKVEARKALLMSLLGNLRQTEVGSCFATAPAICLLDSSPEIVAMHMKELLEDNKLTIRNEGLEVDVPLNQRTSRANAQITLSVQADGFCYDTPGGRWHAPYKLHETPGMQGALTALGIAPGAREQAIITALEEMSASGDDLGNVSNQQILTHLTRDRPDRDKAFASAINAFTGKEDVRLLRAWEYTLASTAEVHFNTAKIAGMGSVFLFGSPITDAPELQSLASKDLAFRSRLQSDPRFASAPLQQISEELFQDMSVLMQQRLCLLYAADADAEQNMNSADGVSDRGGFMLYARTPPDDPAKWQCIDNPVKFQAMMVDLINEASRETHALLGYVPGNWETNSEVLEKTTRHLMDCIQEDSFIEHVAHNVAQDAGGPHLPWTPRSGGNPVWLVSDLGGEFEWFANGDTSIQPHPTEAEIAGDWKEPGDATHVIQFFCGALKPMERALRDKASRTHPDFKVPVATLDHTFSLMPMAFEEAWKDANGNPQRWIDDKLEKPATKYLNAQRTKPSLFELLDSLGEQLGPDHLWQVKDLYQQIAHIRVSGTSYSLRRVHQAIAEYCQHQQDGGALLERAEDFLASTVPVPAIPFADTNWSSDTGEAILVEASYNPFKKRVEANLAVDGGNNRSLVDQRWLDNYWKLSTPLMSAA